jgi:hypothetical protein
MKLSTIVFVLAALLELLCAIGSLANLSEIGKKRMFQLIYWPRREFFDERGWTYWGLAVFIFLATIFLEVILGFAGW